MSKKAIETMVKDQNLAPYFSIENGNSKTPVLDEIGDIMEIDATKNPSITFWDMFFHKEYLSKKEILDATGLSERWFNMVVDEYYSPGLRKIRTDSLAQQTLTRHLERKDLRVHQRLISELFWKTMMFVSVAERIEKSTRNYEIQEEDIEEEFVDITQYLITVEELEVAMNFFVANLVVRWQSKDSKMN